MYGLIRECNELSQTKIPPSTAPAASCVRCCARACPAKLAWASAVAAVVIASAQINRSIDQSIVGATWGVVVQRGWRASCAVPIPPSHPLLLCRCSRKASSWRPFQKLGRGSSSASASSATSARQSRHPPTSPWGLLPAGGCLLPVGGWLVAEGWLAAVDRSNRIESNRNSKLQACIPSSGFSNRLNRPTPPPQEAMADAAAPEAAVVDVDALAAAVTKQVCNFRND